MISDLAVIARENELAALAEFLADARETPCALLLEGDAGIGKSTLWEAAVLQARAQAMRVLVARPRMPEMGLSFSALGDLLEQVELEQVENLAAPRRRALQVALLLEEPEPVERKPDQRAVALALLDVLRTLAETAPVLVAIDDAQWLDRSSALALEFAWRRTRTEPVGLLLAARSEREPGLPELERITAETRTHRLALEPLSAGAIQRLLRTQYGLALARPTLRRVHDACAGNPFHALELGRLLALAGSPAPDEPLPVPPTLRAVVESRLASLPTAVQDVLLAVAATADPTVALLESLDSNPRRMRGHLSTAHAARLVQVEAGHVRFSHPLYAAGVYQRSDPATRRALHRALAAKVSGREERARHLALAADGADADAAAALDDAAHHAAARGALTSAAELAELAARLTATTDETALLRRSLVAADFHLSSGAPAQARAAVEPLLDAGLPGPERADVLERIARASETLDTYLARCHEALELAGDDDIRLSRIYGLLISGWTQGGGSRHALHYSALALMHAERSGDRRLRAVATAQRGRAELWAGRPTAALLENDGGLESARDNLSFYESPRMILALLRHYQGRLDESRALLEAGLREATATGEDVSCVEIRGRLVELELRAGNWSAASAHQGAADELSEQFGVEHVGRASLFRKALLEAHRGNSELARAAAEEGVQLSEHAQVETHRLMNLGALGFLELSLGNAAAADNYLRPTITWLLRLELALATFPVAAYALETLVEIGELDQARPLINQFGEEGNRLESPWAQSVAGRLQGSLHAAAGDHAQALATLHRVLACHDTRAWPFEHARTLLAIGELQRRSKHKQLARQSLTAALAAFDRLEAPLWSARARADLARISGRKPGRQELTATEQQVAELVAAGQTNREVAAALFIAPRTVEWNLSKIYAKLGVRSRTELARQLTRSDRDETRTLT